MNTHSMKLVTVIAEPVLREQLLLEIRRLGSTGVTVSQVQGEGSKQSHSTEVPGEKIKIECIVPFDTAERVLDYVSGKYFQNYSVIAYTMDVEVIRSKKYEPGGNR